MSIICPKCGEVLVDGKEHGTPEACMSSMKELVRRVRQVFQECSLAISKCRAKRHDGRRVLMPLNICSHCMAAGFSGYQVAHEIATSGRIPGPRPMVKP